MNLGSSLRFHLHDLRLEPETFLPKSHLIHPVLFLLHLTNTAISVHNLILARGKVCEVLLTRREIPVCHTPGKSCSLGGRRG